jgi:hypothetical protein
MRSMLDVSKGCLNWAVLVELGAMPYHFYWVRALLKFHRGAVSSNSALLQAVARADALLASDTYTDEHGRVRQCEDCWTAKMATALQSIGQKAGQTAQGDGWASRVRTGHALAPELAQVTVALKAAYDRLAWQECTGHSARDPEAPHRKTLTYFTHFKPAQGRPGYLKLDMAMHKQIKQMARFRLSCHTLRVETGRRTGTAWADRRCTRCNAEHLSTLDCGVDDEQHMIFDCQAFEHLRKAFAQG